MKLPNHIAIIMDGNGRWGLKKYNSRLSGHEHGIKNIKPILNYFLKKKIKNLTLYALSYDNLKKRNKSEIKNLFFLLKKYLTENQNFFIKNKVYLNFIGEKNNIPNYVNKIIKSNSNNNKKSINLKLNIAFNYSSRKEIILALNNIVKKNKKINEKNIQNSLFVCQDPDILIRTGGYSRLSDFLLWQLSYTELFFVNKLWPDFRVNDLKKILLKFNSISRNFGS